MFHPAFCPFCLKTLKNPKKCLKNFHIDFQHFRLQNAYGGAFFLQKYLVISKKSSTFALAFEKQVCFDFLPEARTLKFRFSNEDLIFLRQTERKDESN